MPHTTPPTPKFAPSVSSNPAHKYTIDQVKQLSPSTLLKLIQRAKSFLKTNKVMKEICDKYDADVNDIDFVPVRFGDIDVSAQTNKGVIILNYKLLCDGKFHNNIHYLVHELKHYFDQCYNSRPTVGAEEGDYLSNVFEQSAFKRQVEFLDDQFGQQEADNYVEHLLDHHDKEGPERKKLEKTLKEFVDD